MPGDFNGKELGRIVELTGQTLEFEDRFIAGCFDRNDSYRTSGLVPGIWFCTYERYFQILTQRALLPSFEYVVKLEWGPEHFDIALFRSPAQELAAVGEMKLWLSSTGKVEIPSIKRDIEKLSGSSCSQFLLIFTLSPLGKTKENVDWLLNELESADKEHFVYKFRSPAPDARGGVQPGEFAVVGLLLRP